MSYETMINEDPERFFRAFATVQSAQQAMYKVAKEWAQKNGNYHSPDGTVSYTKRIRNSAYISVKDAIKSLTGQNLNAERLAELKFTQQAFIANLGEQRARQVLQQMAKDGCFKSFKTQYWRLQVK